MILTDYYLLKHISEKSVYRYDCTTSTASYPDFEQLRNKKGQFFVYFGDVPEQFNASAQRKADKAITKTKSISSVYVPDIEKRFGYGDVKNTLDALLFVFTADYKEIEVFVARGKKNNRRQLYTLFVEGELNEEIQALRKQAKEEKTE